MNRKELLGALHSSMKDLQQRIDRHFDLMDRLLENKTGDVTPEIMLNACPPRAREQVLKNAIHDAIDILEGTRKAFKSKTLETLRKNLTQVLIDLE